MFKPTPNVLSSSSTSQAAITCISTFKHAQCPIYRASKGKSTIKILYQ